MMRTVEDAAVDLIEATARLSHARTEVDRVAAALDARWAANRAARSGPPRRPISAVMGTATLIQPQAMNASFSWQILASAIVAIGG